jgi:hypothetical protein
VSEYQYEQSQQSPFQQYIMEVVGQQMDENPDAIHGLLQFKYASGGEFFQTLQQYGMPQPSSQYNEDSMHFDSMDVTDSQQDDWGQQTTPATREKHFVQAEYIAESEGEDDPLEFETEQEAQAYALNLSCELVDEIITEIIAEEFQTAGVLDIDEQTRAGWSTGLAFTYVLEAMKK